MAEQTSRPLETRHPGIRGVTYCNTSSLIMGNDYYRYLIDPQSMQKLGTNKLLKTLSTIHTSSETPQKHKIFEYSINISYGICIYHCIL